MFHSFNGKLKTLATISTLTLVVSCGGGGGGSTPAPTPTPSPTPAPAPTPTPTPPPAPTTDHSGLPPLTATEIVDGEHLSGGDATTAITNDEAFGQMPNSVRDNFRQRANFAAGNFVFRRQHDNSGPLLNAGSCQGCHLKDGRGLVPRDENDPMLSMFLRISDTQGTHDPIYGNQLQTFAILSFTTNDRNSGLPVAGGSINGTELFGEAYAFIRYEEVSGQYDDGTNYTLRKPIYVVRDLSYGDFAPNTIFSPRVSPSVFGSGLLEAIPEDNIKALADENDSNNDGISGRYVTITNRVNGQREVARFGHKLITSAVLHQSAGAYRGDMGITNQFFPEEPCTSRQQACNLAAEREDANGDQVDIDDVRLAEVEFYVRTLAVPVRRGYDASSDSWDTDISAGRRLFFETGCVGCHTPRHVTGEAQGSALGELSISGLSPNAAPIEVLSNQTIYPYSDLLLHDMGGSCQVTRELNDGTSCQAGDDCFYVQRCEGLADGRPEGQASGTEWRTPPLWGLGLVKTVNDEATFLHDGRARTIEEAILWHTGEASNAQGAFKALSQNERTQLLAFLNSL